jgi:subtilisin family serine protease
MRAWLLAAGFAGIAAMLAGHHAAWATDAASTNAPRQILVMLHLPPPHYRPGIRYDNYEHAPGRAARRREAERLAHAYGLALESDWPMPILGVDCYVLRAPPGKAVADILRNLAHDPRAQWAQPVNTFHGLSETGSLSALQPSTRLWDLPELHAASTGRGVSIAVIDSGVDAAHPELAGRLAIDRDFVDDRDAVPAESHGTAVAGIIGARADAGDGIVGIAPQARLLALRACWETTAGKTLCSSFTLAKALQFAIGNGAEVINLSLGGPRDELLARLLDAAHKRGITTVAAVDPQMPDGGFPASHAGVLAVSDSAMPTLPLSVLPAPGRDIPATLPDGRFGFVSGTSFAAAQVSGLVALIRQLNPALTMASPSDWAVFPAGAPTAPGLVDACATLHREIPALDCGPPSTAQARHATR